MVDAEQLRQFLGVGRPPLHGVEQAQLPVQQGLAAPGQAQEDVADAAAQFGLLDRDAHGGLLHGVERLADLADLVASEVQRWRLGVHVHPLAVLQPLHHPGQAVGGQLMGRVAEALQLADEGAGGGDRDDDGGDNGDQAQETGQDEADEHPHGDWFGPVECGSSPLISDFCQPDNDGSDGRCPFAGLDGQGTANAALLDDTVFHRPIANKVRLAHVLDKAVAISRRQPGQRAVKQEPLSSDELDEVGVLGGLERPGRECTGHQCVLLSLELLGSEDVNKSTDVSSDLLVVELP